MNVSSFLRLCTPPIVAIIYRKLRGKMNLSNNIYRPRDGSKQELDIYWSEDMAHQLENWGKGNAWNEIECLLVNCNGKILDIACGTGVNIMLMSRFKQLDLYGFDISDYLIRKAIDKGIEASRLSVQDATKTNFKDNEFDYSYSIGSLEHFTESGIESFLKESSRFTSRASFHMIPVSESQKNEGWMRTNQSFHNNSIEWWLERFRRYFSNVYVIDSAWQQPGLSVGRWFICIK